MEITMLDPLINEYRGRKGDTVYYMRGETQCERPYLKASDHNTQTQKDNRSRFGRAVRSWQELPAEEKDKYAKKALYLNMSGYNLYISEYMKSGISQEAKPQPEQSQAFLMLSAERQHSSAFASSSLPLRFIFAYASLTRLTWPLLIEIGKQSGENGAICPSGIAPPDSPYYFL